MGKAFTPRGAGLKENPGSLMGRSPPMHPGAVQEKYSAMPDNFSPGIWSFSGEFGGGSGGGDGLIPAPQRGGGFGLGET